MPSQYSIEFPLVMIFIIAVAFTALVSRGEAVEPSVYTWVEAENPASANFEYDVTPAKSGVLSGGKWISRTLQADEIAAVVPEEGLLLSYELSVPEPGAYEIWARIGWEWSRAPFEWRVDDGNWQRVEPAEQTTNVMELGLWMEVAWLRLDTVELESDSITLHLRYREPSSDGGRLLMGLDCLALVKGNFVPEGRLKPGESYDSEVDREAASQVFQLPGLQEIGARRAAPVQRVEIKLNGLWQVARYDDPDMDKNTFEPVMKVPTADKYPLRWTAIKVPGSLWNKDETIFAHRVIYRTKVNIPDEHRDRGFYLHFSGTNWIVSVFVNGKLAGTHQGVWVPWDLDISKFITPGEVNEIAVAVKGHYYAIDQKHYGDRGDLDKYRNIPRSRPRNIRWFAPIYPSTKGDGNGAEYGIVNPVTLVSVGDVYTEDIFIKPSVENGKLETDVTIRNTRGQERNLQVHCEAVYDGNNEVERSFGPVNVIVPANGTTKLTISGAWTDPKLWWPEPNPHLYRLRTIISEDGKTVDVQEELFGFREVTVKGAGVYINGVRRNFWNWVGVPGSPYTGEDWLEGFRSDKDRFTRFSANRKTSNFLKTREERLEFYDRNGIAGRLCSMIDGMYISFALGDRERVGKETEFIPNELVWEGFRRHMDQLTRAYRNHPSVIMYQVENELVYINGMNIYGSHLGIIEELMNDVVEAGRTNDPTRPYTVGGAGDLSGRLEVNSPHYPLGNLDWYPDNAYTLDRYATKIARWAWDRKKPWIVGESAYSSHLRFGSYVLGDEVFRGTHQAQSGKAKFLRMLYGGYRWAGVSGFFPWDNLGHHEDSQKVFSDLCVIPRKQTHRLFGGRESKFLFKVMNDTLSKKPVTFEWSYELRGIKIAGEKMTLQIEPGFGEEQELIIQPPETDRRVRGFLNLKVTQPGAEDYVDSRVVPVLPVVSSIRAESRIMILDRSGKLETFLTQAGVDFAGIQNLAAAVTQQSERDLLIIGPDTLTPVEAFGQDILTFAARGGRVIVLEQEIPAAGSNLPAPMTTTTHSGGYAHAQALGTPLFRDLGKEDLIDWAGGHPTYKNVYVKPTQGARSLVECGGLLRYTALAEMACGKGVIVVCQLRVGANLGIDPAADILLRNMIKTYDDYSPVKGIAAVYAPDSDLIMDSIRDTGAFAETAAGIEQALDPDKYKAAIIHATKENLVTLNDLKWEAGAFRDNGGWIMLMGLEPDGLEEFNAFVGMDHMIRPCRIERVTLERPDFPLSATLGNRDLSMYGTEWIAQWQGTRWLSGDVYSFVVDGLDIAPFCRMPGGPEDPLEYKPSRDDKDPYNLVNGMLSSDFWRYIRQIWIPEAGAEPLTFTLRRPDTIKQINIWNNASYWTIKDMDIIIDGDEDNPIKAQLPDSRDLTEIKLPQPTKVQKTVTLQIRSWREKRPDRPDVRLVGVDNVQFLRTRVPGGSIFMDNIGGLVAYPRRGGGVLLNQIKFMEDEPNKENADKKLRVLNVLLQNMGVGSQTASVAVPGVNVRYETIDITDYCTQYIAENAGKPGWFGDKGKDLRNLRMGEQTFANVLYHLVDYATAPVPDCIMLGADRAPDGLPREVEGIKIGKKADMIFFLHAAKVTRPIRDDERARIGARRNAFDLPEVARYVIHYDDGSSVDVPVILEKHVRHWEQEEPMPLEEGVVATTFPIPGIQDRKGVLYSLQFRNPRPDIEIASIDVVLGKDKNDRYGRRAIPALLAITLGRTLD